HVSLATFFRTPTARACVHAKVPLVLLLLQSVPVPRGHRNLLAAITCTAVTKSQELLGPAESRAVWPALRSERHASPSRDYHLCVVIHMPVTREECTGSTLTGSQTQRKRCPLPVDGLC
ncbi:unnamed protein product, partial [Ectocarpus sp. 12 AP-2014]